MATKKKSESFAGIPRAVMQHHDYKNLSGNAVKLLMALCYQYRGHSNGNLTAAFSIMQKHGFRSQDTLNRAKQELLKADLIRQTRTGLFQNPGGRCALYALTWYPIDECPGRRLEVEPIHLGQKQMTHSRIRRKTISGIRIGMAPESVSTPHLFPDKAHPLSHLFPYRYGPSLSTDSVVLITFTRVLGNTETSQTVRAHQKAALLLGGKPGGNNGAAGRRLHLTWGRVYSV